MRCFFRCVIYKKTRGESEKLNAGGYVWGANGDVCATRKTFGDGDDDDVQRATFENARNNVCLNYIREFRTQVRADQL